MQITVDIPEELADRLDPWRDRLPEILELGIRELNADGRTNLEGSAAVMEFLADLPTPEEIIALRPSPALTRRIHQLLEKRQSQGLTAEEERQWQQYEYLEHLVRVAKARAMARLKDS